MVQTEDRPIQIGDIVRLKPGEPMRVIAVDGRWGFCEFERGGVLDRREFLMNELERVRLVEIAGRENPGA